MKKLFFILLFGLITLPCFAAGYNPLTDPQFVEGRILIHPRPGLTQDKMNKIISHYGGHDAWTIPQIDLHVIQLPPNVDTTKIMRALNNNPNFDFAELDFAVAPTYIPNDPYFPQSWYITDINADNAWDLTKGSGVIVAVLDTGVDGTHPDLQSNLVPGWNFYDNNSDTSDVLGHGTAVAGVVAEIGDNSIGSAGTSYESQIMPLRVTDSQGYGYFSLMAQAITYAADNSARVANLSFLNVSLSSSVDLAAQYMRSMNGEVVVAAGNTGAYSSNPPLDSLTVVAATDSNDVTANFSAWGEFVDMAAPGVGDFTSLQGGGYGGFSGTSASSPVVAGVYALMISIAPGLDSVQLDNAMFSTARDYGDPGWDQHYGYGIVDAYAAVLEASGQPPPPPDTEAPVATITSPTGGEVSGDVTVDVSATDNVGVTNTELYVDGQLYASDSFTPYSYVLDTTQYPDGLITLTAKAYDAAQNVGTSDPVVVTVNNTPVDTESPVVTILSPVDGDTISGTVTVSASATDNDSVATMTLYIDGSQVDIWQNTGSISYSWTPKPPRGHGRYADPYPADITVVASDPSGNEGTDSITVHVTKSAGAGKGNGHK